MRLGFDHDINEPFHESNICSVYVRIRDNSFDKIVIRIIGIAGINDRDSISSLVGHEKPAVRSGPDSVRVADERRSCQLLILWLLRLKITIFPSGSGLPALGAGPPMVM